MNKFLEYGRMAFQAMRVNLFRTILTMIGIIIGVASVTSIGAIGQSGQQLILKELETFGLRSVWINRRLPSDPKAQVVGGSAITAEDVEALPAACPSVESASPVFGKRGMLFKRGPLVYRGRILACNADFLHIDNEEISHGRFLLPDDVQHRRKVCVIAAEVAEKLFDASENPLGKELDLGLGKFEVIGILKAKDRGFLESIGSRGGESANDRALIPYTVYQKKFNLDAIPTVQAAAMTIEQADAAAEEMMAFLTSRHQGKYEYRAETMKHWLEVTSAVLGTAWWVALMAAFISLFVGGVGIMNIMTSSVIERIKEIGVRKALGAKNMDILWQFLIEAIAISLTGGLLGLVIGVSVTFAIQSASQKPMTLSPDFIWLSLGVSIAVGVLSGWYPAYRAAKWDPVEALRYE